MSVFSNKRHMIALRPNGWLCLFIAATVFSPKGQTESLKESVQCASELYASMGAWEGFAPGLFVEGEVRGLIIPRCSDGVSPAPSRQTVAAPCPIYFFSEDGDSFRFTPNNKKSRPSLMDNKACRQYNTLFESRYQKAPSSSIHFAYMECLSALSIPEDINSLAKKALSQRRSYSASTRTLAPDQAKAGADPGKWNDRTDPRSLELQRRNDFAESQYTPNEGKSVLLSELRLWTDLFLYENYNPGEADMGQILETLPACAKVEDLDLKGIVGAYGATGLEQDARPEESLSPTSSQ